MSKSLYRPATDSIDPTAPGGVEAMLAFHRLTFGDARMEAEGDGGEGEGEAAASFKDPDTGDTYAFPPNTPVKDMTEGQKSEYWRHKARKHEDRVKTMSDYETLKAERDALKSKHLTDDEKALDAATTSAAEKARAEVRSEYAARLVTAEFRAANSGRIPADKLTAVLDGIEPTKFLTADGEVDTDKVQTFVDGIAPAKSEKWPDMGQGRRSQGDSKSVAAGRDLYSSRHAKKS
ncbi:hypothetical protein [Sanguibacter sp. HDW7]|uniref:hypothetical protein n=1 Tax=Sanguibacter sp. HDW7 TaxID=2714931 RepID=UPI00140B4BFC|nr:hypothetical protein [Sanguibacter sp. HDW7]QIK82406.1 hypothetical protein G7063_01340 [Sanguibacter sp. HDW7]